MSMSPVSLEDEWAVEGVRSPFCAPLVEVDGLGMVIGEGMLAMGERRRRGAGREPRRQQRAIYCRHESRKAKRAVSGRRRARVQGSEMTSAVDGG